MKTSWKRPQDVTFRRLLQDILMKTNIFALIVHLQETSSRRLGQDQYIRFEQISSRCLQDIFKTSTRRLQDLQVELVIGNTSSRSIARAVIYRRIFLVHNSEKVMVSVQNLQEREKFSSFSFLLYYTFAYYTF